MKTLFMTQMILVVILSVARAEKYFIGNNVKNTTFGEFKYLAISPMKWTWDEAKKWCEALNGTLAILDTLEKRTQVKNALGRQLGHKNYWLGLEDVDCDYKWVNGTKAVLNYSVYGTPSGVAERKCFYINITDEVKPFKKMKCNNTLWRFFCEFHFSLATDTGNNVKNISFHEFEYLAIYKKKWTWDEAKEWCKAKNGKLAILDTPEKQSKIRDVLVRQQGHKKYWIGLQYISGELRWINGSKADLNTTLYTNKTNKTKCYSIKIDDQNIPFKKRNCNSTLDRFICEFHLYSAIDTGSYSSNEQTSTNPSPSSSSSFSTGATSSAEETTETSSRSAHPATTVITTPSSKTTQKNDKLTRMINNFRDVTKKLNTSEPDSMKELLKEYDALMQNIDGPGVDVEYNPLTDAQSIEHIAMEFTMMHLDTNRTSLNISNKNIAFYAKLIASDTDSDVVFPEASEQSDVNTITMPKSLFQGQETYVVNVVFKNKKTIREKTPKVMEGKVDKKKWLVNTEIFSMSIFPKKDEPFEDVKITLSHLQKKKHAKPYCGFWNFSIPTPYNGSWSERGCRVVSSTENLTVCACNHSTNFAILMQLNPDEPVSVHQKALSIITYIGLSLSLLGEVITVLLYCVFLNLQHEKIQIRVNLLCALGAAQIVFMAGIDKTGNKDVCTFVAAMIHMLYLASFCWMLMEGVYLYRMVVKVFDAHITMRYSYLFACGFPLSVVSVSLVVAYFQVEGVHSYISPGYCWIRFDNGFIWSFVGPVLLLIAINTFFLFSVLKEMATMKSAKTINSFDRSSLKASARACVVLLPILGITWVFGLLSLITTNHGVVWQYIFTILNTTQGFMIFLLHCLRNTELRTAMELRYFQWESNHSSHNSHGRVTPSRDGKFSTIDDSDKGRSDSIPMATKGNKVSPK